MAVHEHAWTLYGLVLEQYEHVRALKLHQRQTSFKEIRISGKWTTNFSTTETMATIATATARAKKMSYVGCSGGARDACHISTQPRTESGERAVCVCAQVDERKMIVNKILRILYSWSQHIAFAIVFHSLSSSSSKFVDFYFFSCCRTAKSSLK